MSGSLGPGGLFAFPGAFASALACPGEFSDRTSLGAPSNKQTKKNDPRTPKQENANTEKFGAKIHQPIAWPRLSWAVRGAKMIPSLSPRAAGRLPCFVFAGPLVAILKVYCSGQGGGKAEGKWILVVLVPKQL